MEYAAAEAQDKNALGTAQSLLALISRAHDLVAGFEPVKGPMLGPGGGPPQPTMEPQGVIAMMRDAEHALLALCDRLERISSAVGRL